MSSTALFVQEMDGQNWHVLDVKRWPLPDGSYWIAMCGVGAGNVPYRIRTGAVVEGRGTFTIFPSTTVLIDLCPACAEKCG